MRSWQASSHPATPCSPKVRVLLLVLQTGSGKTYTMGSAFTPGGDARGVIPSVMETIFDRVGAAQRDVDFTVRVGFVEIHKVCGRQA